MEGNGVGEARIEKGRIGKLAAGGASVVCARRASGRSEGRIMMERLSSVLI